MTDDLAQAITRLRGRAARAQTWADEYRRCNRREAAERQELADDLRLVLDAASLNRSRADG